MNIDDALRAIAAVNGLKVVDISFRGDGRDCSPFGATLHGAGIGSHNVCFGYGDTISEALANAITEAGEQRAARAGTFEIEMAVVS